MSSLQSPCFLGSVMAHENKCPNMVQIKTRSTYLVRYRSNLGLALSV